MSTSDKQAIADALTAFVKATPRAAIEVLRQRRKELLTDTALELLTSNLARYADDAETRAIFELRQRAIIAAREHGVEAGVAHLYRPEPALRQAVSALVNAANYTEMNDLLRTHPLLLGPDAVECLEMLAWLNVYRPHPGGALDVARALVEEARTEGVDGARRWLRDLLVAKIQSGSALDPDMIDPWEDALRLTNADSEAETAAQIRVNLGQAYWARARDGDPVDIDLAVSHLTRALEVFTVDRHRAHYCGVHRVLGNIRFADPRTSLEQQSTYALEHYRRALEGISADADAENFLHINFMMASCYQALDQPQQAHMHLRLCLEAVDRADLRQAIEACAQLAKTMRDGGADIAAALDEALDHLSTRIEHLPKTDRNGMAWAHYDLANVYRELYGPSRGKALECSIAHTRAASEIWTRDENADLWARTQHNLGVAFEKRIEGEQADNVEQAIACFENALAVHTREAYPRYWALTHNALAAAWLSRVRGDPDNNAQTAAQILEGALSVWDAKTNAFHWAECHNLLACASMRLVSRRGSAALDSAIASLENVARVHTREHHRSRWSQSQTNLAIALFERKGPGDVERALAVLQQCVEATDRQTESYLWANFKQTEAAAHSQLDDGGDVHFRAALAALHDALGVFDVLTYPAEHRDAQATLGHLWFRRRAWAEALGAYRQAIAAAESVFRRAYTETGRLTEAQELSTIYRNAAFCLVQCGEPAEALVLHDRGKTRVLTDAIAFSQTRFDGLPADQRAEAAAARDDITRAEDEMRRPAATPGRRSDAILGRSIAQARGRLALAAGQVAAPHMGVQDALGLIPDDGALVVPLLTAQGGVAITVPFGTTAITSDHVLPLAVTSDEANDMLVGSEAQPGLLRAYADHVNARWRGDREIRRRAFYRYFLKIEEICRRLWLAIMRPVCERLQDQGIPLCAPVLLVPDGALAFLPLHAAAVEGEAGFLDRFTARFAPSLSVLAQTGARAAGPSPMTRMLAVANPGGDLRFAGLECAELARLLDRDHCDCLAGADAVKTVVLERLGAATHLHMSCHGFYAWWDPLRSGLVLASGEVLDVADFMSPRVDLGATRLVTLSACETGMSEYARYPDEYVGLSAGLLVAGAPAVVSSLWAVEDRSTSLLMSEFYRRLLAGEGIAPALCGAQRWLAQLTLADLRLWVAERCEIYRQEARERPELVEASSVLNSWADELADMRDVPPESRPYEQPYYWAAFSALGSV